MFIEHPTHRARKRFGQNFLHDARVIDRIVKAINPKSGQRIVEIGPGQGALTVPLLEAAQPIHAVELDRDLAAWLNQQLKARGLVLIEADALSFDFSSLATDGERLRVVGNLPYNISTPLMFHLLQQRHVIHDMHFMLQKEVVERLAAEPGNKDYGRLSVMTQYLCDVQPLFDVPPGAFHPPPKVTSAIVRLVPHQGNNPHGEADIETLDTLLRAAFHARRKTLRNNLKALLAAPQIEAIDINWSLRPEQLSVAEYVHLSRQLPKTSASHAPDAGDGSC
jgi:16S rRNA (adenine1518-N6/adenine1519-N6)-dimethyltransferase